VTARLAEGHGIAARVVYLAGGGLDELLADAAGLVTLNSTAGLAALARGTPAIALGAAIYDLPGLTFEGGLDRFWREAAAPDAALALAFRRAVAARTQVPGGLYDRDGMARAVAGAAARLPRAAPPERDGSRSAAKALESRPNLSTEAGDEGGGGDGRGYPDSRRAAADAQGQ
jgi:capsular polysaccharide export protein